jgi:hypothetical protein
MNKVKQWNYGFECLLPLAIETRCKSQLVAGRLGELMPEETAEDAIISIRTRESEK